jgi:ADP-heptose:LPS heptosyltransferase
LAEIPTLFYSVSNNRAGCTLSFAKAAYLLNRLNERRIFCTIINSLPHDRDKAEKLASLLEGPSKVISTELFADFLEILNSCDAVFVGDGGACHLASALQKPTVALFGGTIFSRWRPLSDKAICFPTQGHVDALCDDELLEALETIFSL